MDSIDTRLSNQDFLVLVLSGLDAGQIYSKENLVGVFSEEENSVEETHYLINGRNFTSGPRSVSEDFEDEWRELVKISFIRSQGSNGKYFVDPFLHARARYLRLNIEISNEDNNYLTGLGSKLRESEK